MCVSSSQGRYCEAVDQWERAKEEGMAGPTLYTSVMEMAAQVGGAETVQHVREDMEREGWSMDHKYTIPTTFDDTDVLYRCSVYTDAIT